MTLAAARALVLTRDQLRRAGATDRALARDVQAGALVRVHPGRYVAAESWASTYSEDRHLLRVVAAAGSDRGGDSVLSHVSAAVVWGLPLFRVEPRRVHVTIASGNGQVARSKPTVARHQRSVDRADRAHADGLACTGLARTVADCIRALPREGSIALADAAFRRVAWNDGARRYDDEAAARFRSEVAARLPVGGRGVRVAREILALADGRAQLPGESVSRLYLTDLGFAPPRLQVPIRAPGGGWYYVDFGLDDIDIWGEFDGRSKYADAVAAGQSLETRLRAEKDREDWIRGTTRRRMIHWYMEHVASLSTFRQHLTHLHVRIP